MKKNNKQRIFLNSIIVFVNSIADKGIFVIISIVLARYFSVDDYGVYTTALWYATFFSSFTNIGINQSVIRSINLESQYDREHFANALLIKTVLAFIVYLSMVLSLFIISKTSSMYDGDTIYLILVFGIIRIGNEYLQVFKALYEAREKFFTSSLILTSFSLSFLMGTVVVIFVNGSYFHVAYIRLGIVIAFIALYALLTFRSFQPRFDPKTLRRFIEGAVPFGLSTIFNNTYQRLNGIILSLIHGTVYTGIFQNGFIFLSTLQFIPSEFRRVLLPFLYKNAIDKKAHMFQFAFEIYSKIYAVISLYIFTILFLFARDIILLVFTNDYIQSVPVLVVSSFSVPFIFNIAPVIITSIDRQKINTQIKGGAVLLNIAAGLVLIKFYGAVGAAWTAVVSSITVYIASHIYLVKNGHIKYRSVFINNCKLIAISALIITVHMYLDYKLYFMIDMIVVTILYGVFNLLFIVDREDIRIVREIIGLKTHDRN